MKARGAHGRLNDFLTHLGAAPERLELPAPEGRLSVENATVVLPGRPDPVLVADALGLKPTDLKQSTHPPVLGGVGLEFVLVELATRDALASIRTDISRFRDGAALFPAALDFAIYAYVREGDEVEARMFAPLDNIAEDPATGSAAAALAAFLHGEGAHDLSLVITQGADMGRPSSIRVRSSGTPPIVTLSGKAVLVMEGRLV